MDMKVLLIAAGAYVAYKLYSAQPAPAPASPQQDPAGTAAAAAAAAKAAADQAAAVVPPTVNATTRALLVKANGGDPAKTASFHGWNYLYRAARAPSATLPAPEDVGMGDGNGLITVDEYLAAIGKAGLAGLRGLVAITQGRF